LQKAKEKARREQLENEARIKLEQDKVAAELAET
jgi:hypothetical protein